MQRLKVNENVIIDSKTIQSMEDEIFSNLKAVKYLRGLGLDDKTIKDNVAKIYDFAVDMKNCKDCRGIEFCNKEPKYLVSSVTFKNGIVDRNIIPCKKYLEHTSFKNRLMVHDFPDEWFSNIIIRDVSNLKSKAKLGILMVYQNAVEGVRNRWAFIKGGIASGKSFFAATLSVDAARANTFSSICFINVPDRFKELADLAFSKSPDFNTEIDKYKNADFLVLDDFGNEFKSDFVRDNILFPILSYRVKNKLFTIITSNYKMDECASMYQTTNASKPKIEQIRSMLRLMCKEEFTLADPSLQ